MSFQIGDVVVLKSGGPNMTVTFVEGGSKIFCTWFPNGASKAESGNFPAAALEKA